MHALRDLIHECGISITLSQNGITKAHKIQSKSKAQKKRKQRTSKEQHMAYNNNNNNNKKIVVFGATGSVGTDLIEIVSNNEPNWKIVAVSRSGPNTNARLASLHLPNVDIVKGDVEDLESAKQITNDADMVFSCVGFVQYEQRYWVKHWPKVVDNLLAVTSVDRPLIFCDNLYAYGNPQTPINPSTKTLPPGMQTKPAIRSLLRVKLTKRMKEAPG